MKKAILIFALTLYHFIGSSQETGTLTDPHDGKVYKTVKIGTQWIMAENLAHKPENGVYWGDYRLDRVDSSYLEKYGYIYDFKTANAIAIPGWHIPTVDEWKELRKYLGGDSKKVYYAIIEGGSSGFNALLSGLPNMLGFINAQGKMTGFWSSTKHGNGGYGMSLSAPGKFTAPVVSIGISVAYGFNVRLFKDN